ncbi:hypothetical protein [Amycolatopsis sp. NBC_01480]|nr:hypothetical protein [Amycolatopsis sp. NBC_01480]
MFFFMLLFFCPFALWIFLSVLSHVMVWLVVVGVLVLAVWLVVRMVKR